MLKFSAKYFLVATFILASCNFGNLEDRELSFTNIESVSVTSIDKSIRLQAITLQASQLDEFTKIVSDRTKSFNKFEPCYYMIIKLRDGGGLTYLTDGISFIGQDDSSDRPFSFSVKQNVITEVFHLTKCK